MGFVTYGALIWLIGKIGKIGMAEKIGFYMMVAGAVLWGIGLVGIHLPIPLPLSPI